jgi:hypothetical protein
VLKQILIIASTTVTLVKAANEPLEFAVSLLEQVADKLEKVASILEEYVPREE